jgi:hypothetical protein
LLLIATSNFNGRGEESVTLIATASSHVCWLWKQKFLKREKEGQERSISCILLLNCLIHHGGNKLQIEERERKVKTEASHAFFCLIV